jgi:hypothetical protein
MIEQTPQTDPEALINAHMKRVELDSQKEHYTVLDNPEMRYRYVCYTESLIARAIEEETDSMIFLDKSARPVAWLMKELWPTLGFKDFDETGEKIPAKMPEIKFANIDREQWALVMGRSENKEGRGISLDDVPKRIIDDLTALYSERTIDQGEALTEDEPTLFDDKNILIVDEVSASGDTLTMSEMLFEAAFHKVKSVNGAHWMPSVRKQNPKTGTWQNADLPVWYDARTKYGRLINNRDYVVSSSSSSARQRRGGLFLSTPFPEPDQKGLKLRREMKMLAREVADGDMPVRFGVKRPGSAEFRQHFMEEVNGLTLQEFAELRKQSEAEQVPFSYLVKTYKRTAHEL